MPTGSESARIHDQLDHPVIDSDGHIIEFEPAVFDLLRDLVGPEVLERFRTESHSTNNFGNFCRVWYGRFLTHEQQIDERVPRSPWWGVPTRRTFDRAAACLP